MSPWLAALLIVGPSPPACCLSDKTSELRVISVQGCESDVQSRRDELPTLHSMDGQQLFSGEAETPVRRAQHEAVGSWCGVQPAESPVAVHAHVPPRTDVSSGQERSRGN